MAKMVEIYGSPGVGKTTIYDALKHRWKKNNNWIPGDQLFLRNKIKLQSFNLFFSTTLKRIRNGSIDEAAMKEAGDRFISEFPRFIDIFWNEIFIQQKKSLNGLDLRLEKAKYFYNTIQRVQLIRESPSKKFALIDEGLIHRLTSWGYEDEDLDEEKEKMQKLLDIMPLPQALIYAELDTNENAKRLAYRKKLIRMHESLNDDELKKIICKTRKKMETVTSVLRDYGIPLLRIEAKLPVANNVLKIKAFLNELN